MARVSLGAALICGALLAGGCATHEVSKGGEVLAPSATDGASAKREQTQKDGHNQEVAPVALKGSDAQRGGLPQKEVGTKLTSVPDAVHNAGQSGELKAALAEVYFNFNSANLSPEARATLVKDADLLRASVKGTIRVEGNCDERGSDDYNLALGEKRAKEAVQYLVNLGLPADRFTVISYGKEKPAAPGHDEASWAKNRRDEFVVIPEGKQ